ncbi:MAG: transketolase C-terminal domain-containing protein [Bacillota bacterium]|nr:transketolase C-terminal domain-containing protein [Bacillota bacterium]
MSSKSIRQQFSDTMLDVGKEDPNLAVLVGDISHFILQPFAQACPGRYYNVGICEPTILSMAAGMSKIGFHTVVHTIAPFLIERGFEQIKLDFCYQKISGNIITVGSVFDYSNLGCTHHCYGDFALLKTLPGAQIVYPASAEEFDVLFRETYKNEYLTVFRLPGTQHGQKSGTDKICFGKGITVREGSNLTIVATGPHLKTALDAVEDLVSVSWDPEIIYLHTIRPIDAELLLESLRKTKRVCVIEEHMRSGGLGDDVLRLAHGVGGLEFISLSIPDEFVTTYGSYEDHCRHVGLTSENLINKIVGTFISPCGH